MGRFRAFVHEVGKGPLAEQLIGIRARQERRGLLDPDERRELDADLHALAAALAWIIPLARARYRATISHTDADARLDDGIAHGAWTASYLDGLARHARHGRSFADFMRLKLTLALRAEHLARARRCVLLLDGREDALAHLSPQLRTIRQRFSGRNRVR